MPSLSLYTPPDEADPSEAEEGQGDGDVVGQGGEEGGGDSGASGSGSCLIGVVDCDCGGGRDGEYGGVKKGNLWRGR